MPIILTINICLCFVAVGAGSAGAVLANRLSEDGHTKVLLLEAGGEESYVTEIPLTALLWQRTRIDWEYQTVPQIGGCLGLEHHVCIFFNLN